MLPNQMHKLKGVKKTQYVTLQHFSACEWGDETP